ncbi:MAG: hypothetical protein Q9218_005341 [Villophora microphyllina]
MAYGQMNLLNSFLRFKLKVGKATDRSITSAPSTSGKSSSSGSSNGLSEPVGSGRLRGPGLNPKIRMYRQDKTKPAEQTAFCLPSCPLADDDMHSMGLYLHEGKPSQSLSFLFGAHNPPPGIWLAHEKLMNGEASEDEEDLVLEFLKHHPFQPGNVTDKIWWSKDEPAQFMMEGNPLSEMAPELEPTIFQPIRVAPIKPAGW